MSIITLYQGTAGLNTVIDPKSINSNAEDGLIDLSQAVNISINDRGLCELRNGKIKKFNGEFHSLFCKGGDCFVIQENVSSASIMRVNVDYSLTSVRTGLTKNMRMAWDQTGSDTFYSNGMQSGYIRNGVSAAWPVQTYQGADADMQFATAIPAARHIAFMMGGMVLLAVGNAVFANHAPFQYGLFSKVRGNVAAFESNVIMLAAVQGGFYVSDCSRTWFFRKTENWYQFRQELCEDSSAIEYSLAQESVKLNDIGIETPGYGRVWASTTGICVGTDAGQVINITKAKVKYPSGYNSGACLIKDYTVIHTVE